MLKRPLPDRETQVRLARFLVVGGVGLGLQLGSFRLLEAFLPVRLAFSLAFALSVASHYTLNRFWALPSRRRDSGRQLLEYGATIAISYAVSFAGFNICYALLGLSAMWSTALAVPASTLVVFVLLNYRVFR